MRDKLQVKHTKKTKMINMTNVTLASDDDWQREAPKVGQQIYYTTTKQN